MANYNQSVQRGDMRQPVEQVLADAIIQSLPEASLVLGAGTRRVTLSRAQARIPVLSMLPEAYFVSGDTGLKETTKQAWENRFLNVEELAVIVPIPDNVIDDADMDILAAVQPRIVEAVGAKLDAAVLFGVGKPATWDMGDGPTTNGLAQVCVAKGNYVNAGASVYADIVSTTKMVASDGHPVSAFLADSIYEYDLLGVTDTLGRPLFTPSPTAGGVGSLLGRPFRWLNNGAWDDTYHFIAGDLQNLIVGIRRDISWEVFREGVISDATGKVILNLMQQDSRALRMTLRIAFTVGNPLKRRSKDNPNAFPFAVLKS